MTIKARRKISFPAIVEKVMGEEQSVRAARVFGGCGGGGNAGSLPPFFLASFQGHSHHTLGELMGFIETAISHERRTLN